jgi:hypothetical protein
MVWWNPELLNEHIAPGFDQFTAAEIPDLRDEFPEAQHWLGDYFLNSVLRGRFDDPQRQLVVAFLRRTQHAFDAYHSARDLTGTFLATRGEDPGIHGYYAAVSQWEWFTVDYSMTVDLYKRLFGRRLFEKGDHSAESSLYTIANNVKHIANSLDAHPEGFPAVPLWLTNRALRSYAGVSITYRSAASLLRDMARVADDLRDPAALGGAKGDAG